MQSFIVAADLYDDLDTLLEDQGLTCQCLGGGIITCNAESKRIRVFGKSQVGPCCFHHR